MISKPTECAQLGYTEQYIVHVVMHQLNTMDVVARQHCDASCSCMPCLSTPPQLTSADALVMSGAQPVCVLQPPEAVAV